MKNRMRQGHMLIVYIVKFEDNRIEYYGDGINQAQIEAIHRLHHHSKETPVFFGRHDTLGLLGYILPLQRSLAIFRTTDNVTESCDDMMFAYSFQDDPFDILGMQFTANEAVFIEIRARNDTSDGLIVELLSIQHLEAALTERSHSRALGDPMLPAQPFHYTRRCSFAPKYWCTNASTFAALNANSKVYTYATDRRIPRSVGRETNVQSDAKVECAQLVPYLEESRVVRLASGGWLTVAVTEDGELNIWGQTSVHLPGQVIFFSFHPGRKQGSSKILTYYREIALLREEHNDNDDADEYVKTHQFRLDGHTASVTHVAIGFAHVLVAVEADRGEGEIQRSVYGVGNNEKGALGLGTLLDAKSFMEDFTEIKAFRGMKVNQIVCEGWSSFVVIDILDDSGNSKR